MIRRVILMLALAATQAAADPADVVDAEVTRNADGTYRIAVTVASDETGWDKYADRWQVLAPDGTVLATRVLHHPHVTEQPFTRSLRSVALPGDVGRVRLRAHDSVEGFGGAELVVPLP